MRAAMIRLQKQETSMSLGIHPAAMLFPEMSDDEWRNLHDDIRDNGQREEIVVYKGQVIDGRNRLRACAWLGIEPKTREYHGTDEGILPYVMSLNLHRRHLTESQRAMVAAKIANAKEGRPVKVQSQPVTSSPAKPETAQIVTVSQGDAAKMLNVSRKSVSLAKQIGAKAEPEVTAAVEAGRMTLNEATKVVQLRPELQRQVAELPKAERRETIAGNSLDELEVNKDDEFALERQSLIMVLGDIAKLKGPPDKLILDCPKFAAPRINKHFRQAFMKMQALQSAYQNWEYRNVSDD